MKDHLEKCVEYKQKCDTCTGYYKPNKEDKSEHDCFQILKELKKDFE